MATERHPFFPDTVYHVVHHGNGNDNIFLKHENYIHFLNKYRQYISPIADTYAYCLMPNHFHIGLKIKDLEILKYAFATRAGIKKYANVVFTPAQIEERIAEIDDETIHLKIAKQFADFLNAYAKGFNTMYQRGGSLFRESVYREPVSNPRYYANLVRYIHNNPIKHGFVEKASDWQYSSIHSYNLMRFNVLSGDEVMNWFGGAEPFWAFHELGEKSDVFSLFDI
jgi:putative transposase